MQIIVVVVTCHTIGAITPQSVDTFPDPVCREVVVTKCRCNPACCRRPRLPTGKIARSIGATQGGLAGPHAYRARLALNCSAGRRTGSPPAAPHGLCRPTCHRFPACRRGRIGMAASHRHIAAWSSPSSGRCCRCLSSWGTGYRDRTFGGFLCTYLPRALCPLRDVPGVVVARCGAASCLRPATAGH